jgi:hemerythrin
MIGMPVINLDDEEGKLLCIERTRGIMSGTTLAIETNHIRKDGSVFPVAIFANKIEVAGQAPIILTTEHDISEIEEKIAERTKRLLESNIHLEELSLTDTLTKLPNRRYAMQKLASSWEESSKHNTPLVCIMIDSDNFKEVNDTYGHDAGDAVLCTLAETLRQTIRDTDMACRLGGDEFLIICPNTDLDHGISIAELICKAISTRCEQDIKETSRYSASAGVAVRSPDMTSYENLIKAADNSVYEAKRAGKNCVRTIS